MKSPHLHPPLPPSTKNGPCTWSVSHNEQGFRNNSHSITFATSKSTWLADVTPGSDTFTTTLRVGFFPSASLTITECPGAHSASSPSPDPLAQEEEAACCELISSINGLDFSRVGTSADGALEDDRFVVLREFKMSDGRGDESAESKIN